VVDFKGKLVKTAVFASYINMRFLLYHIDFKIKLIKISVNLRYLNKWSKKWGIP
jgi:hypothetical protein